MHGGDCASRWPSWLSEHPISKPTLIRVERGASGVSIGSYAPVLFVLGMEDRLADVVDSRNDHVGLQLEEENLPQRIRGSRKQKPMKRG